VRVHPSGAADPKRVPLRTSAALLAAAAALVAVPASAPAATSGGVPVPSAPSVPSVPTVPSGGGSGTSAGGGVAGETADSGSSTPKPAKGTSSLDVASFSLNGSNFFAYGRSIRASFEIRGRSGAKADVKLVVVRGGTRVKTVALGQRPVNSRQAHVLPTDGLPSGSLELRLSARDSRGRAIKGAAPRTVTIQSHRFPVVGPHTFGAEGSKFGADRDGGKRKHQGQDVSAAEGTPMVAARGGVVRFTGNQPSGAGVYVVIAGAGEGRDYVYMHLVEGSLLVRKGDTVRTGQLIGQVGTTGASSGPHLHFEIWQGVWQGGGTPIDPLPLLQRWDSWS
jgi:murein DD-endopeptidase MepM/ murein hydrolase activator NlpD